MREVVTSLRPARFGASVGRNALRGRTARELRREALGAGALGAGGLLAASGVGNGVGVIAPPGRASTRAGGSSSSRVRSMYPSSGGGMFAGRMTSLEKSVGRGGGFVISPAQTLYSDVPWENVVAFFEAVEEYGDCHLTRT